LVTNENGCTEIGQFKQKSTDVDCEYNSNDFYYNAPEINSHGGTDKTLERFVDEEKVFNKWLQSCVQTNTIVLNSSFLELLNFFTDRGSCDVELFNGKPTEGMFSEQTDGCKIFKGPSVSAEHTVYANDQPMRNADRSLRLSVDGYQGGSQVASTSAVREINNCSENIDPEDMFDGYIDHSTFKRPIGKQTSAICGDSHDTKPDQNIRTRKLNFIDLFKSQLADTDDFMNRNTSFSVRPLSVDDDDVGRSNDSSSDIVTGTVIRDVDLDEDDEVTGELDFEELFKSQRADRFIEKYSEEIISERPKLGHHSEAVMYSSGGKKVETCHEGKIDDVVLFESQRSDEYIKDFMVNDTDFRVQPSNADDRGLHGVNLDDNDDDENQEKDDEFMGKIDFEKPHKIQRSDNCMEKKTAAGRQNVDRSIVNDSRKSPVVCGGGKKTVTSGHQSTGKMDFSALYKNQRSDGYIEDFMVRNTKPRVRPSNTVDRVLLDVDDDQDKADELMGKISSEKLCNSQRAGKFMKKDESTKSSSERLNVNRSIINGGRKSPVVCGGASGKALFKSQRVDEYIKDYTDKIVAKKVGVVDGLLGSDAWVDDDDDDVICLNSSQEFFSCRPPKKTTQTKLTGHVRVERPIEEIVDLLSPPPSSSCTATAFAVSLPIAKDVIPTGSVSISGVGGSGLLQTHDEDDDDMDFMFIDYNSDGDVADVFTQKHRDVDDTDVFTQKKQDDGDADVFTQKHRDDSDVDLFSKKQRDGSGTTAAVSPPLSSDVSATKPALKVDVTKRTSNSTKSYDSGMMPFNIMKAARLVDLLKPGLSMKRNMTASKQKVDNGFPGAALKRQVDKGCTAAASKRKVDKGSPVVALKRQVDKGCSSGKFKRQIENASPVAAFKRHVNIASPVSMFKRKVKNGSPVAGIKRQFDNGSMTALELNRKIGQSPADDMSPIHPPNRQRQRPQFSQSTPKVSVHPKQRRQETVSTSATTVTTTRKVNSLLTSSSDSDAFVGYGCVENTTSPRLRVKKKRRRKPKKVSILIINDNYSNSFIVCNSFDLIIRFPCKAKYTMSRAWFIYFIIISL